MVFAHAAITLFFPSSLAPAQKNSEDQIVYSNWSSYFFFLTRCRIWLNRLSSQTSPDCWCLHHGWIHAVLIFIFIVSLFHFFFLACVCFFTHCSLPPVKFKHVLLGTRGAERRLWMSRQGWGSLCSIYEASHLNVKCREEGWSGRSRADARRALGGKRGAAGEGIDWVGKVKPVSSQPTAFSPQSSGHLFWETMWVLLSARMKTAKKKREKKSGVSHALNPAQVGTICLP